MGGEWQWQTEQPGLFAPLIASCTFVMTLYFDYYLHLYFYMYLFWFSHFLCSYSVIWVEYQMEHTISCHSALCAQRYWCKALTKPTCKSIHVSTSFDPQTCTQFAFSFATGEELHGLAFKFELAQSMQFSASPCKWCPNEMKNKRE